MGEEKNTETKAKKIGKEIHDKLEAYFDEEPNEDSNAMEDEEDHAGEEDAHLCDYLVGLCGIIEKAGNNDERIKSNLILCITDLKNKEITLNVSSKITQIFQKTLDEYYPEPPGLSQDFKKKLVM